MDFEIKLDDRLSKVKLLKQENNRHVVKVDDRKYDLDITMLEEDVYSILCNGKSYTVELVEGETNKNYIVNTLYHTFDAEVVDAESRYMQSRNQSTAGDAAKVIASPMPGKVMKILVQPGDEVTQGQALIVVSAMKMESEYKAGTDGVVKEIPVKENDTVAANQTLIILE